ncbi:hypothetical protein GMST_28250 [Geomonas silvestris]|uniref:Uncharacterized protein n=1 Tax=Geomonas silvestris TaxID=2740184 RepID=A0A6V8MKH3_9BACT|nr:hypothetical protein [Geomonas silvestris]GFO60500.1 hypothetical protein GMST_28250 [Geomonas silvestris]
MRDSLAILLAAAGISVLAWAFWHFAGGRGVDILTSFLLLILTADNIRLRRCLRNKTIVAAGSAQIQNDSRSG